MIFIKAFIIGGLFCLIAQFIMDKFKLIPLHMTLLFVVIGSLLTCFNLYDKLIAFSEAGAILQISSFGYNLTTGAITEAKESGFIGIFKGMLSKTSVIMSFSIICATFASLIFKPKG